MARRNGEGPAQHADAGEALKDTLGKRPSSGAETANPDLKSWRDVLPVHPAADLFPLMSEDELRVLGEDIKERGQIVPIVLSSERPPRLVDGRNRLDAMELVGLKIVLGGKTLNRDHVHATFLGGKDDPHEFVVSANIHRRHLTAEQKRELIAKLIKAQPEKSNRQIADTIKVTTDKTVGAVRRELEGRAEIPHVETRTDTKGRKQPTTKARPTPKEMPDIEKFADQLCLSIGAAFPTDTMQAKLDAVIKWRDELSEENLSALVRSLGNLSARSDKFAGRLTGEEAAAAIPVPTVVVTTPSALLAAINRVMTLGAQETVWPRGQTRECKKLLNEIRLRHVRLHELAQTEARRRREP